MLSTPFEFQIVFTPKPMHRTESTTLVLSLQKFPRTAVIQFVNVVPHLSPKTGCTVVLVKPHPCTIDPITRLF